MCDAFCLINTGAMHTCIAEDFMNSCGLNSIALPEDSIHVSTPLGKGAILTKLCRDVDVLVFDTHLPIDMFVLPISDFDVILGMDWLSKYRATIDCAKAELKFSLGDRIINFTLLRQRPPSMITMELWEKPRLATLSVNEDKLKIKITPVVSKYVDVFPDELPGLPPDREIQFGIDLVLSIAPISKAPYRLAPIKLVELKNQLQELQDKDFIRPSISPWGAPVLFVKKKDGSMRLCINYRELN